MPVCEGAASVRGKADTKTFTVAPGERAALPLNFVRVDTRLEVTVSAKKFQPFQLGRGGADLYRGGWVEVTDKDVIMYDVILVNKVLEEDHAIDGGGAKAKVARVRAPKEKLRFEHGMNLSKVKSVHVCIDCVHETVTLTMKAGKQCFETPLKGWWAGGEPYVSNLGTEPVRAELSFTRCKADASVWYVGASYFNTATASRWPYYMRKEGYDDFMADHLPGGSSVQMLGCFKDDLRFGTPKIAVWMMMANNKADTDVIDPDWLRDTQEFISICKEKGIEPILTIYPKIAKNHTLKSEWIRRSGLRYVDLYTIMCNPDGSWRNPAWLGKDKVHPTSEGAKAMWEGIKRDLPDLFKK